MYLVKSLNAYFGTNAERTAAGLSSFLAGDEFNETDTGNVYQHNGMAWVKTAVDGSGYLPLSGGTLTGGLVVNSSGGDNDTTIQGDTATKLGVFDAGLDAFQVGTTVAGAIADFRNSGIIFNNSESDRDFRIAGNGVTNGYFYDAGLDRHGFGTGSPNALVDIAGELRTSSGSDYVSIQTTGGLGSFRSIVSSGNATLDFDPDPADNSGNALFRFFRNANTSGAVRVQIFKGDGSGTQIHIIDAKGTTVFNEQGDDLDFRIETNNDPNAFVTNGGTDNVGIGTASPAASAKLEISSTTGALLLPRMTTTQRNALTAVNGMIIYNTTNNVIEGYENGSWVNL